LLKRIDFKYDALGNRVEKDVTVNATTTITHYAFDGGNVWADLSSTNTLQNRYIYLGGVDQLVARVSYSGTATVGVGALGRFTASRAPTKRSTIVGSLLGPSLPRRPVQKGPRSAFQAMHDDFALGLMLLDHLARRDHEPDDFHLLGTNQGLRLRRGQRRPKRPNVHDFMRLCVRNSHCRFLLSWGDEETAS
jgi:hypothetical protein